MQPPDWSEERQRVQALIEERRFDAAVAALESICQDATGTARDWLTLGQLRLQLNQAGAALDALERADTESPGQAPIVNAIAHALFSLGRAEEAYSRLQNQIVLTTDDVELYVNLGYVGEQLNLGDAACAHYSAALSLDPRHYRALLNRAALLRDSGSHDDALVDYASLVDAYPEDATAWLDQAECLSTTGRFEDAVASADRAIAIDANNVNAIMCNAVAHASLGEVEKAQLQFEQAFRIDRATAGNYGQLDGPATAPPDPRAIHVYQAFQRLYRADWRGYDDLLASLKRYIASPSGPPNDLSMAFPAMYMPLTAQESGTIHTAIADEVVRLAGAPLAVVAPVRKTRLRIGYVSSKFHPHPSFILTRGLYSAHDRDRFEIFAYALDSDNDDLERIEATRLADAFIDVSGMSDADATARIRADEIDILIDLNGFSDDARPAILARRPAPIQVSYLGHMHSLYAPWIDYRFTDRVAEPDLPGYSPPEARAFLPQSFYVYDECRRPRTDPPGRGALSLPQDDFVLCGFNGPAKFEPTVFDAWMTILKRVPESVLWLIDPGAETAANLMRAAEHAGVSPARLILAPYVASHASHVERLQTADLFLDTFSHGAHTNALDGLHADVPLVTRQGDTWCSRVGASLCAALEMTELIAESADAYVDLICGLASDHERLRRLKTQLSTTIERANPFASAPVAAKIEAACEQMWDRFAAGEPPADFDVSV